MPKYNDFFADSFDFSREDRSATQGYVLDRNFEPRGTEVSPHYAGVCP